MQRSLDANRLLYADWWSKLTDGILAATLLYLTSILIALLMRPIELLYGASGLLVYTLIMLAISMYFLQQSISVRHADINRAWYGIAGGFFTWMVAEINTHIGIPMPIPVGLVPLIMVSLIVALLWRNHLPVGARFFSLTFLINWAGFLLVSIQERLAALSPIFILLYWGTGVLAVIAFVVVILWILFRSQRRIERAGGALVLWFLINIALYVFRGSVY
jgi:hypothetical protein